MNELMETNVVTWSWYDSLDRHEMIGLYNLSILFRGFGMKFATYSIGDRTQNTMYVTTTLW
jgi:hypothetical protein